MNLIWTKQALERLQDIENFVTQRSSSEMALKLINNFIDRAETLEDFPSMGRILPELSRNEVRELIEGNYRIIYRLYENKIVILTVFEAHKLFLEKDIT